MMWRLTCGKIQGAVNKEHVTRTWVSNNIPLIMCGVITYPCHKCLWHWSPYITMKLMQDIYAIRIYVHIWLFLNCSIVIQNIRVANLQMSCNDLPKWYGTSSVVLPGGVQNFRVICQMILKLLTDIFFSQISAQDEFWTNLFYNLYRSPQTKQNTNHSYKCQLSAIKHDV